MEFDAETAAERGSASRGTPGAMMIDADQQ
jgi:hypothetical protein